MENLKIVKITAIKPDTIVFDLTDNDKYHLRKKAKDAVLNHKKGDLNITIINQSISDFSSQNKIDEIS